LPKAEIFPQEGYDFFIFPFKDRAGAIDEAGARGQAFGYMAQDLFLYFVVVADFFGVEKKEFFGGAAPGAAAGAGGVDEDKIEIFGAGDWGGWSRGV
jgi:hypothetical protein